MQHTLENLEKQHERKRSNLEVGKTRQIDMGRRWSGIHRRKNLCTKQQEDQGGNSKGES